MTDFYSTLVKQAEALSEGVDYDITIYANVAALIYNSMDRLNWAGFYLMRDGVLKLGPFQGQTACVLIPVGKGVCGTAVAEAATQLVKDVHQFPGHIACDSRSNSEIVVPIFKGEKIIGVLDIDSPELARFDGEDEEGLTALVRVIEKYI